MYYRNEEKYIYDILSVENVDLPANTNKLFVTLFINNYTKCKNVYENQQNGDFLNLLIDHNDDLCDMKKNLLFCLERY